MALTFLDDEPQQPLALREGDGTYASCEALTVPWRAPQESATIMRRLRSKTSPQSGTASRWAPEVVAVALDAPRPGEVSAAAGAAAKLPVYCAARPAESAQIRRRRGGGEPGCEAPLSVESSSRAATADELSLLTRETWAKPREPKAGLAVPSAEGFEIVR